MFPYGPLSTLLRVFVCISSVDSAFVLNPISTVYLPYDINLYGFDKRAAEVSAFDPKTSYVYTVGIRENINEAVDCEGISVKTYRGMNEDGHGQRKRHRGSSTDVDTGDELNTADRADVGQSSSADVDTENELNTADRADVGQRQRADVPSSKKKARRYIQWEQHEEAEVVSYFYSFIVGKEANKLPGKKEIEVFLQSSSVKYDWAVVKTEVMNEKIKRDRLFSFFNFRYNNH